MVIFEQKENCGGCWLRLHTQIRLQHMNVRQTVLKLNSLHFLDISHKSVFYDQNQKALLVPGEK